MKLASIKQSLISLNEINSHKDARELHQQSFFFMEKNSNIFSKNLTIMNLDPESRSEKVSVFKSSRILVYERHSQTL